MATIDNQKQRDLTIDLLKFFAVFIITSSHFEPYYHPYEFLATGGAIGDALFFFCSGYTLLLKDISKENFFNWYKRRINRIFPILFAWALISGLILSWKNYSFVYLLSCQEWPFVICILVYYVVFFALRKVIVKHPWQVLVLAIGVSFANYMVSESSNLYAWTWPAYVNYFSFMLMGATAGKYRTQVNHRVYDFAWLLCFVAVYYGLLYLSYKQGSRVLMFVSVLPLFGIIVYFWKLMQITLLNKMYYSKYGNIAIMIISNICLEVYVCQPPLIMGKIPVTLYPLFPLNIPIGFVTILSLAFIIHILSNFISQTFNESKYDWRKMVLFWK